jgi:hypothetical protein
MGFGMFYDRFTLSNTLAALRYNGVVQQQYTITNPDFFPNIPSRASLAGFDTTRAIQQLSYTLRAPYVMQGAASVERELPFRSTLAVTYAMTHGLHMLRSEAIGAARGPIFLMESAGLYNQNQLIFNVTTKVNTTVSLFGSYVLNRARSNTDGLGTFPAQPYSMAGEYGPASTDIHNRMSFGWVDRSDPLEGPAESIGDRGIGAAFRHHRGRRLVTHYPL